MVKANNAQEQCWILIGKRDPGSGKWRVRKRSRSRGTFASVEADWQWTLSREEEYGDVMGFYHTHPDSVGAEPSSRDVRTMRAWSSCLGKPLLCLIRSRRKTEAYVFKNDADPGRPLEIESIRSNSFVIKQENHD